MALAIFQACSSLNWTTLTSASLEPDPDIKNHGYLEFTAPPTTPPAPASLQSQTGAPPPTAPAFCTAHKAYAPADTRKSRRYRGGCCAYYRRRGERPHRARATVLTSTLRLPGARSRSLLSEDPSGAGKGYEASGPRT